jgi:hypothetical protein
MVVRAQFAGHDRGPLRGVLDARPELELGVDRRGPFVRDRQRSGREPDRLARADRPARPAVRVRHRGTDAVAVEDGRDDPAVQDVGRPRHVLGTRAERRQRFIGIVL